MEKLVGIYKIINIKNNKHYIGSSSHLLRRKREHFYNLSRNTHCNRYLQFSYNKYGHQSFQFVIIELCEQEILLNREQEYLNQSIREDLYNLKMVEFQPVNKTQIEISSDLLRAELNIYQEMVELISIIKNLTNTLQKGNL